MSARFTSAQIDALFSQDVDTRLHAARQLEIVRFGRLEDLDHEEYLMATADWLARNGADTALPQLQRLLGHPDTLVRAHAAGAVARIDPALGLAILETLLEEDDRKVRSYVIERLCSIELPEVVKILSQALLSLYSYADPSGIDPSDDWTPRPAPGDDLRSGTLGGSVCPGQPDAGGAGWRSQGAEECDWSLGQHPQR